MMTFNELSPQFKLNFNEWICYFRNNIHRFVCEYFGIELKTFQKILLYCMSKPMTQDLTTFDLFASRGIGKSWITMVFSCAMATLYPNLEIVVVSSSIKTAKMFMKKINELMEYPNLAQEIKDITFGREESLILFKNGSNICSKVCNDNARGTRCQILIFEERNLMDSQIIRKVFIPFLTKKRSIPAYRKPEYKRFKQYEHNYKIYLTSVGYTDDDAYREFIQFGDFMMNGDKNYDVFSIPYQFGVAEGVIDKSLIISQAKENKSSIEDFQSEMEVIPIGSNENAIFTHIEISKSRQIVVPLIEPTLKQYVEVRGELQNISTYMPKQYGEKRIMSIDIATAMGRRNDASAWTIFRLFEKGDYYEKHVAFHRALNGVNIDMQTLYTKRLWKFFDIDYIVIDAGGAIGIAFANLLGSLTVDMQLGITYPGFRTMNNSQKFDMRVTDENAIPVLYCMQVSGAGASQMQADMSFISKMNFERSRIFLLIDDSEGIEELNDRYKYIKYKTSNDYNEREIADNMIMSYLHTNALIKEMLTVKLKKLPSGRFTLEEKNMERKDRLISLLYGCFFIDKLEHDLNVTEHKNNIMEYAQKSVKNIKIGNKNPFAARKAVNFFRR